MQFVDNDDYEHNNILQSLFKAEERFTNGAYVSYSDIVFTSQVVKRLKQAKGDICVVVDRDFKRTYEGRKFHPFTQCEVKW